MLLNDMHNDWREEDNDTREPIVLLHTDGSSLWSDVAAVVPVTELRLSYFSLKHNIGELCVHFNTDAWRVDKHGLIYTDWLFISELYDYLISQGYDEPDISYSEQGMQGDNYVSFDVGPEFIGTYLAKHPEAAARNIDDELDD